MRNMSAAALAKIATEKGIESVLVVRIKWRQNGPVIYYSDRYFSDPKIEGRIISFGDLDNITKISGSGQSQSVNIVFDDKDGYFKTIIDKHDIHKMPATVIQWFTGLPFSDSFILFKGFISSPIAWKEGERTLSFDIVSRLEDNEVGFSAEEGQFPIVPHKLIGKPWPLAFGTNVKVPALRLNEVPTGTTVDQIAFPDPDLLNKIGDNERAAGAQSQAYQTNGHNAAKATRFKSVIQFDIDQVESALAHSAADPDFVPELNLGSGQFSAEVGSQIASISPYVIKLPDNTVENS